MYLHLTEWNSYLECVNTTVISMVILKHCFGVKVIQESTKLNHKNIRILLLHLLLWVRGTFRCMDSYHNSAWFSTLNRPMTKIIILFACLISHSVWVCVGGEDYYPTQNSFVQTKWKCSAHIVWRVGQATNGPSLEDLLTSYTVFAFLGHFT